MNRAKKVNSGMFDNLRMVCDMELCDLECFSTPTLKSQTDFDHINEWRVVEDMVTEGIRNEVTEMTLEKQWMVIKQCRPVTLIKEWGSSSVGQNCTYHSTEFENLRIRPSSSMEYRNVMSYHSAMAGRYSYREDSTIIASDECGVVFNNTDCLNHNAACIAAWNMIYNNSNAAQQGMMKHLILLAESATKVERLKQELLHLGQQKKIAETSNEMENSNLQVLQDVHKSTLANVDSLWLLLKHYKSLVDEVDQFNITSVNLRSSIQDHYSDIFDFECKYFLPMAKEENITKLHIDITMPFTNLVQLIIENMFSKMSLDLHDSPPYPINSRMQFYTYRVFSD